MTLRSTPGLMKGRNPSASTALSTRLTDASVCSFFHYYYQRSMLLPITYRGRKGSSVTIREDVSKGHILICHCCRRMSGYVVIVAKGDGELYRR